MKYKYISKVFRQLKKYHLNDIIGERDAIYNWLSTLSSRQIQNFLSLDIDFNSISFPLTILIDRNVLNCWDYKKRIEYFLKLKNCQENMLLQKDLCNDVFLNSKTFYQDIEALSKYGIPTISLSFLSNDVFIKSKYHEEDLKLILTAKDKGVNGIDFLISSALVKIACSKNSINSQYHQTDMKIVFNCDSSCLQLDGCKEGYSANHLAVNKISLSDKFHVDNMKLLLLNPVANQFLFDLMTDPKIIKSSNYQTKLKLIATSKSRQTAKAMYLYIKNPSKELISKYKLFDNYDNCKNLNDLLNRRVNCNNNFNFIENLCSINGIPDEYIMHYVLLLMNPNFFNDKNLENILLILQNIKSKEIFLDVFNYLTNKISINLPYKDEDIFFISNAENSKIRSLLLKVACNYYNLQSINHKDDMLCIFRLNPELLTDKVYNILEYYMLHINGINDENRQIIFNKITNNSIDIGINSNVSLMSSDNTNKKYGKFKMKRKNLYLVKSIIRKM